LGKISLWRPSNEANCAQDFALPNLRGTRVSGSVPEAKQSKEGVLREDHGGADHSHRPQTWMSSIAQALVMLAFSVLVRWIV
jgi:hypothetical protein